MISQKYYGFDVEVDLISTGYVFLPTTTDKLDLAEDEPQIYDVQSNSPRIIMKKP